LFVRHGCAHPGEWMCLFGMDVDLGVFAGDCEAGVCTSAGVQVIVRHGCAHRLRLNSGKSRLRPNPGPRRVRYPSPGDDLSKE
jgi:hypothetical protein